MDTVEVTPKITWGPSVLGGSLYGYAGKAQVWQLGWSGKDRYSLRCKLPGVKEHVYVASEEEGKARAERQLAAFLRIIGEERES